MKRVTLLALPALLLSLGLASCSKDPVSPSSGSGPGASLETAAIQAALDQTPELADVDTYEAPGEGELADATAPTGSFSTAAATNPVFFFRVIRERTHSVQITTERDSAFEFAAVRVEDRLSGTLNLVTVDSVDTGIVRRIVKKPLRDLAVMRARFRRPLGVDQDAEAMRDRCRGWRLVAVSNREVASPEHSAKIVSVRLEAASGLAVTVTDPLALMRFPEALPRVAVGEPVKVTVEVADPTNVVFLLAGWGRQRLHEVSPGIFAGGFRAPVELRRFRVGVNALSRGTLADDAAPYDSDFWGLLARTAPPMTAAN